jgi:hypothetical protein
MDEIEMKSKKNYELLINNSINFIKSDLLSKAKKIEEMQIQEESESSSDSSSDRSSDSSSSSEDSDSEGSGGKKERKSKK